MTRQEEINEAVITYMDGLFEDGVEIPIEDYTNIEEGFEASAKWADTHPNSPWISVKEDLPYHHFELIEPIPVDSPFESETLSVLVIDNIGYSWFDYMVLYKNIWKWKHLDSEPSYWMPIPNLSKEQEVKL